MATYTRNGVQVPRPLPRSTESEGSQFVGEQNVSKETTLKSCRRNLSGELGDDSLSPSEDRSDPEERERLNRLGQRIREGRLLQKLLVEKGVEMRRGTFALSASCFSFGDLLLFLMVLFN